MDFRLVVASFVHGCLLCDRQRLHGMDSAFPADVDDCTSRLFQAVSGPTGSWVTECGASVVEVRVHTPVEVGSNLHASIRESSMPAIFRVSNDSISAWL